MLNLDEDGFRGVVLQAVALARPIRETISGALRGGLGNIHFMGSGGAGILMRPAYQLLRSRSAFPSFSEIPAEVVLDEAVSVGERSLVVIPSLSGTTRESIAAMECAKSRGATVITLTGNAESPLAQQADLTFTVCATDEASSETFYIQSLLIALALMAELGEHSDYEGSVEQIAELPELLLSAKRSFESRAAQVAAELAEREYHIITAAGLVWPEAWCYSMCILEEMQWIRTRPVHAADFFHGTLELVERGVSVMILKGEDTAARVLGERVERFVHRVTDRVTVIDSADFELGGVTAEMRALVSPIVLATVLERLSAHLEAVRRHPLDVRRYYRRLDY